MTPFVPNSSGFFLFLFLYDSVKNLKGFLQGHLIKFMNFLLQTILGASVMSRLEELKGKVKEEASDNPEKYFAVKEMKENGFERRKCKKCGKYFWSIPERKVCGDTKCIGGYKFINDPPTDKTFDFASAWKEFSDFMKERGYKPISRYPVVARWRNDTDFVGASIYNFQPYVVSGEVDPPANPLVVPQFCLRFNDIDNVGITGSHYTGFVMTGQHAFTSPESYNQGKYFEDMLEWIVEGMKIPKEKVVLHEDSWGGGGNLGACMEFFVDGLELFNQVYMLYEIDDSKKGYSELDTKVLDMGMGHERIVWITHGSETSYEANMPRVIEKLYEKTGVSPDEELWRKFLPYSGLLNFDEVENLEEAWSKIAREIGVEKKKLKNEIMPTAGLYSIADHTRALLVAFTDGALPSNTGEKHSLRVITRRALDFMDKYNWDLDLAEVMKWHAEEMEKVFPELKENLDGARKIMEHEEKKYEEMKKRAERKVETLNMEGLDEDKLLELYDSDGISPEMLDRLGYDVEMPEDFYAKVAERHEGETEEEREKELQFEIKDLPDTEFLYWEDEKKREFGGKVLKIYEKNDKYYVVLDRTCFYPQSGGQMYDKGELSGTAVNRVLKRKGIVLHELDGVDFSEGEKIKGSIDWSRRKQLMQHHTATHLINGAAREVLGNHVWQAGAKKTEEKGRLDVTHYESLTEEEVEEIENKAKGWIDEGLDVNKLLMKKSEAEKKYGFRIYQGGVPPGNELRILVIGEDIDVEACGGTHVDNTEEIEDIAITSTTKVQDGVIRIEFKAGKAARKYKKHKEEISRKLAEFIDTEKYELEEIAEIFDVSSEKLPRVVERFVNEWEEREERVESLKGNLNIEEGEGKRPRDPHELFDDWKEKGKRIDKLEERLAEKVKKEILKSEKKFLKKDVDIEDIRSLIQTTQSIVEKGEKKAVLLKGRKAVVAAKGEESNYNIEREVEKEANVVKTSGNLVKGFDLKD